MVTYNPKVELMVLMAIKDQGELTAEEIQQRLQEKWNIEITEKDLTRYLRRWKKRKVIVANMVGKEWAYSLRDIPWWPEAQIIHVVKPDVSDVEAKEFLENYEAELKERGYIAKREPDIKDYETLQITLETIDDVAGGWQSSEENQLLFPRRNGIPFIPRNWLKGYHRWNARLINVNENFARDRFAYSTGEFLEEPKIKKQSKIGKSGPVTYETIPQGTRFTFVLRYPRQGSAIKSRKDIERLYKMCEVAPLRGLGAYDSAFGGRLKLIEIKPLD